MPIKFRCPHCAQFLGISRGKAGAVTDCPTCGRTIRVPKLDGTIEPLPLPKLNAGDADLARALDQLASLADHEAGQAVPLPPLPARPIAEAAAPAPPAEIVHGTNGKLSLDESSEATDRSPPRSMHSPHRPHVDPIDQLADSPIGARSNVSPASRWRAALALVLMAGSGGGILGYLVGRATSSTTPSTVRQPETAAPHPTASDSGSTGENARDSTSSIETTLPSSQGAMKVGVEGRVTYLHASGEARPDQGTRILVIPIRRSGTIMLPVSGFRSGTDAADFLVSQAAVRALGGDFTVADAEGNYRIQLGASGKYHLLMVSRHQGRSATGSDSPAAIAILDDWFEQPRSFFGQTQSVLAEIEYDGHRPSVRDHVFHAAE